MYTSTILANFYPDKNITTLLPILKGFGNLAAFKDYTIYPSTSNLDYAVGSSTATVTAARDATHPASYVLASGLVVLTTTANTARYQGGYYNKDGFNSLAGLMVEGAVTNVVPASAAMSGASWTNTNITVSDSDAGSTAPDGTATVTSLTASAANGTSLLAANAVGQTYSVWLKRKTGRGNVQITANGGSTYATIYVDSTWRRFSVYAASASQKCGIRINTNADAIYAWGNQFEDNPYMTSYIPTTAGALGRVAETIKYPNTGNRTAASESIFIKFAPSWNNVDSAINNRLMATDTKDRALYFDTSLKSFVAYPNITDNAAIKAAQTYKGELNTTQVFATLIQHSSPYTNTFKNGSSQGTYTSGDFTNPAWGTSFYIGSDSSGANQLNGVIQYVVIYSDTKSAANCLAISNVLGVGIVPVNLVINQKFRVTSLSSIQRLRMGEQARNYVIVRNRDSSSTFQIAFSTNTNDDFANVTTGWTDVPPGQEWYETGSTNQIFARSKVNLQSITIDLEVSIPK